MGLMLNFFATEYKKSKIFYNNIMQNIIGYLTSRQVAGKGKKNSKTIFK